MDIKWAEIPGYENYLVSNTGEVLSKVRYVYSKKKCAVVPHYRDKILKKTVGENGYVYVGIGTKHEGNRKTVKVHRIVAEVFLPNPNSLPQVNHKDGNKENNCVDNLEWVTQSQNIRHSYLIGIQPKSKRRKDLFMRNRKDNSIPVEVIGADGERMAFNSMQEFADYIGTDRSCVSKAYNNGTLVKGFRVYNAFGSKAV